MKKEPSSVIYREVQKISPWWVWAIVGAIALFFWYAAFQQLILNRPVGSNPASNRMLLALWLLNGLGLPLK